MPLRPWKILESRYLIRDAWMTLRADRCETPSGFVIDPYYVQEPPDWVQVVAFDADDQILVTRQYRHAAGIISCEFPCGAIEPGEAPAEAARRELMEETGCDFESLMTLPALSPNPARFSNKIHAFVAIGTSRLMAPLCDETEVIEFQFLPLREVLELIDKGAFAQALHVASLYLALRSRGMLVSPVSR